MIKEKYYNIEINFLMLLILMLLIKIKVVNELNWFINRGSILN